MPGGKIELRLARPFPDWALPRLWDWIESCRTRVCDDFAPADFDGFLAEYERRAEMTYGVERGPEGEGELGGFVSVQLINPVAAATHCIFARRFWGRETTVPALRLVYEDVFDRHPELGKISGYVFEDNRQMIERAREAGFREETSPRHPLAACTRRGGKPIGMRVLSLFREDFLNAVSRTRASLHRHGR